MTRVSLSYTKDGVFASCDASGHAGAGVRGKDVVCAAVSVLLRTAMTVLSNTKGVVLKVSPCHAGEVHFDVWLDEGAIDDESAARVKCAADFIECGVQGVMLEYPKNVRLDRHIEGE